MDCTVCKKPLGPALHLECLPGLMAQAGEYISAEAERISRGIEALRKG